MKQIPNMLCVLRILLAVGLLFTPPLSPLFYLLYLLCGVSDVLDGALARRLHAESSLGSRLDSTADFVFVLVLLLRLIPVIRPDRTFLLWIAAITLMRLFAALTAKVRFGQWGFLHTWGNKLTGGLLFLYPLTLPLIWSGAVLYALCAVTALTALEELLIELTDKTWNPDRKSIFTPSTLNN